MVSRLDLKFLVLEDKGSSLGVNGYYFWNEGQWRESVSSARFDSALNGYLEKSGEGKQEGCVECTG